MPKKILFESFIHQFLTAAASLVEENVKSEKKEQFYNFIDHLKFQDKGAGHIEVTHEKNPQFKLDFETKGARFYFRGDSKAFIEIQKKDNLIMHEDQIQIRNQDFFIQCAKRLFHDAGLAI